MHFFVRAGYVFEIVLVIFIDVGQATGHYTAHVWSFGALDYPEIVMVLSTKYYLMTFGEVGFFDDLESRRLAEGAQLIASIATAR